MYWPARYWNRSLAGSCSRIDRDVGGRPGDRDHAARHLADRELAGTRHGARLEDDVGLRRGLAGEDQARAFLLGAERLLRCAPWITRPSSMPALARAAGAVAAPVGQADALADRGVQHRLVAVDAEGLPARLDGDGERHGGRGRRGASLDSARDFARVPKARFCAAAAHLCCSIDRRVSRDRCCSSSAAATSGCASPASLRPRWRVLALTSSPSASPGCAPPASLPLRRRSRPAATLARLAGLADAVLHLAPPPSAARAIRAPATSLQALARSARLRRLVYASTSGVYGDRGGAAPTRRARSRPTTDRARRRVDAEQRLRQFGRAIGVARHAPAHSGHLRARPRRAATARARRARHAGARRRRRRVHQPHPCRRPRARLRRRPASRPPQRAVNVIDDSDLKHGRLLRSGCRSLGLARPPRLSRARSSRSVLSPMQLSFMSESRRLVNRRMKRELRSRLRYPHPSPKGWGAAAPARARSDNRH